MSVSVTEVAPGAIGATQMLVPEESRMSMDESGLPRMTQIQKKPAAMRAFGNLEMPMDFAVVPGAGLEPARTY